MKPLPSFRAVFGRQPPADPARVLQDALALTRRIVTAQGDAAGPKTANALADTLRDVDDALLADYCLAVAQEMPADSDWRILIHQLNLARGGTFLLVELRRRLLAMVKAQPQLTPLEAELGRVLTSWFNRGFLELRRIDWNSPASLLEKLIDYEAVHPMAGWDDLRRRLAADRRCFGFFHPAMPGEPLIFVEVALTDAISEAIAPLLAAPEGAPIAAPSTAIFYSISNCQAGLRGIQFGNLLIKQVVEELRAELPSLETFCTLSPIPGFRRWLAQAFDGSIDRTALETPEWWLDETLSATLETPLRRAAARYLTGTENGRVRDAVAHFHLSNGARIERIDWRANLSPRGIAESWGLMVNYRYLPARIEAAQDGYAQSGTIQRTRRIDALLRPGLRLPFVSGEGALRFGHAYG